MLGLSVKNDTPLINETRMIPDYDGFLSPEIKHYINDIRKQNHDWFSYAEKLNRFVERECLGAKASTIKGELGQVNLFILLLATRTTSNFQATILLSERGMVVEARTLLRCCIENLFYMVAFIENKNDFVEKFVNNYQKDVEAFVQMLPEDNLDSENIDQIQNFLKDNVTSKAKKLLFAEVQKIANLIDFKIAYKELCVDSAHPTIVSLNRYLKDMSGNEVYELNCGPYYKMQDTIVCACITILLTFEIVMSEFSLPCVDQFKKMCDEFTNLEIKAYPKQIFYQSVLAGN